MFVFPALLGFLLVIACGLSFPEEDIPNVEPEYLDMLLETNQHELFSKLMGIENVSLVRPREGERMEKPIFHKELKLGDILPPRKASEERGRQGLIWDDYETYKWQYGYIPYTISRHYKRKERRIILDAIEVWNEEVECIKLYPRENENDYVHIFSGDGCYSSMGCEGGQQPLSLDVDGCVDTDTFLHEMMHALGIAHEHNRMDRDDHIKMCWENIQEDWRAQYEKIDSDEFWDISEYDFYSLMHYPVDAPETHKPAFKVLAPNIDEKKIGHAKDFTEGDLKKIAALYCF